MVFKTTFSCGRIILYMPNNRPAINITAKAIQINFCFCIQIYKVWYLTYWCYHHDSHDPKWQWEASFLSKTCLIFQQWSEDHSKYGPEVYWEVEHSYSKEKPVFRTLDFKQLFSSLDSPQYFSSRSDCSGSLNCSAPNGPTHGFIPPMPRPITYSPRNDSALYSWNSYNSFNIINLVPTYELIEIA